MSEPEKHRQPYEVHSSGAITELFWQIQHKAKREGRGDQVLVAIRDIHQRLQRDPYAVGEPLYHLPVLRMSVRTVAVRPLVVDFAICDDRPLVFIKGIKLLPKHDS